MVNIFVDMRCYYLIVDDVKVILGRLVDGSEIDYCGWLFVYIEFGDVKSGLVEV